MTWLATLLLLALIVPAQAVAPSGERRTNGASGGDSPRAVGSVVRSKEWVIRRAPHREEEFIGEVSYHKGPSLLTSDWALFRHEPQLWDARGHVRLEHTLKSGDRIEVSGATAQFDQKTGRGRLLPTKDALVEYSRTPLIGAPDLGTARRLDWEGQERIHLSGRTHVWGPRLEVWGDRADYDAGHGKLTVSGGRPVVHVLQGDWTGAVQGDTVTALQKPDRILADGKTKGWIRFRDQPGKKKE